MSDIFYKIRHKASGLFYKPARGSQDLNVSRIGKVYAHKPNAKQMDNNKIRLGWNKVGRGHPGYSRATPEDLLVEFNPDDWEIVEFKTSSAIIGWEVNVVKS